MKILQKITGWFGRFLLIIGINLLLIQFLILSSSNWQTELANINWQETLTPETLTQILSQTEQNSLSNDEIQLLLDINPELPTAFGELANTTIINFISFFANETTASPTIIDLSPIKDSFQEGFSQSGLPIDSNQYLAQIPNQVSLEEAFSQLNIEDLTLEKILTIIQTILGLGFILLIAGIIFLIIQFLLTPSPKLKAFVESSKKLRRSFFASTVLYLIAYIANIWFQNDGSQFAFIADIATQLIILPMLIANAVLWILFLIDSIALKKIWLTQLDNIYLNKNKPANVGLPENTERSGGVRMNEIPSDE